MASRLSALGHGTLPLSRWRTLQAGSTLFASMVLQSAHAHESRRPGRPRAPFCRSRGRSFACTRPPARLNAATPLAELRTTHRRRRCPLTFRPQLSIATAIVFYHRFYARESYETYERFQAGAPPTHRSSALRHSLVGCGGSATGCASVGAVPRRWRRHASSWRPRWRRRPRSSRTLSSSATRSSTTPFSRQASPPTATREAAIAPQQHPSSSLAAVSIGLHMLRSRPPVHRRLSAASTGRALVLIGFARAGPSYACTDPDSQELWKLKEQVLICERELLRVLGFDLSVEHAYRPLLAYIKSISGTRDLAQIAWNFSAFARAAHSTQCMHCMHLCTCVLHETAGPAAHMHRLSDTSGGTYHRTCPHR